MEACRKLSSTRCGFQRTAAGILERRSFWRASPTSGFKLVSVQNPDSEAKRGTLYGDLCQAA
eukprot:7615960-Pyramimonas_sp.AAC.1